MKFSIESISAVKFAFAEHGVSISEWARENGFSAGLVYQILEGKRQCLRGQSHKIAVELGLKQGKAGTVLDVNSLLKMQKQASEDRGENM